VNIFDLKKMRKVLSILLAGAVLSALLMPAVSLAVDELPDSCKIRYDLGVDECPPVPSDADYVLCPIDSTEYQCGLCCLLNTIYTVTNWIFFLMMALAVILIVIGGVVYMTAGGDPEKAGKGKSIIVFAIIGLAIALVARFIPPVVKFIMGVSSSTPAPAEESFLRVLAYAKSLLGV